MSEVDFDPIAASLRESLLDFYEERGENVDGPAGQNTLDTNSSVVERRGRPLLEVIQYRAGVGSLEGLQLLDLGAGFGALSLFFAAHGAKVTAVDPNVERFIVGRTVAAHHGLDVRFKRGRVQALKLADQRYDLAVQNNSLCYVVARQDRRRALRETLRVLRPGGLLVARNPNRWHPLDQFTGLPALHLLPPNAASRLAVRFGHPRSRVRIVSIPRARRELLEAGFVEATQERVSRERPEWLELFARYQHLSGRRP